jgi:molecular chaperone GrpE
MAGIEEDAGEDETVDMGGLEKELGEERKMNQELITRLKYAQADLENLRKRLDREMKEAGDAALRGLVSRLLVVQDELELALKHAGSDDKGAELRDGIQMVRRNLAGTLESVGVKRIECLGKPFDPSLHEAVDKVHGGNHGEDIVVEELRPGFTFRGQLLRPSMVKVELASRGPPEEVEASE